MSTVCVVTFPNNEQGVFYAGQLLKCTATITTQKLKSEIKEISINASGSANIRWSESEHHPNSDETTDSMTCTGEEVCFSSTSIVQKDDHNPTFDLMPGTYTYNFETQLPRHTPTSFIGVHGQIHYEVKLTISRPWKFDNIFVKPFTIIYPLNLNLFDDLKEPVEITDEKTTICGCINMSPLQLTARIPISAYVPGQLIPCIVKASTGSSLSCGGIDVSLYQFVVYTSSVQRTETKTQNELIAKVTLPTIAKNSKKVFVAVLMVPPTAPTTLNNCNTIKLRYAVIVEAKVNRWHRNLQIHLPIAIGIVPFTENVVNGDGPSSMDNQYPVSQLSNDSPTYEEATNQPTEYIGQDVHIKYEKFAPKYPMYKNIPISPADYKKNYAADAFYFSFS